VLLLSPAALTAGTLLRNVSEGADAGVDSANVNRDTADVEKTKELQNVTVYGQSIRQKGDRTSVFITRDMRRGAVSTAQMIGNLPNFYFDRALNVLTYNNSQRIAVMVDSVEKSVDLLQNLQHIRFDRVEIIDRPQGQYQGYDVLINLHTKKDYEGYEGRLYHDNGVTLSDYCGKKLIFDNENTYFTYTKNKLTLYGGFNYYFGQGSFNKWWTRYYPLNGLKNEVIENADHSKNTVVFERNLYGNVSADYLIDAKRSVSVVYAYTDQGSNTYCNFTLLRSHDGTDDEQTLRQNTRTRNNDCEHSWAVFYRDNAGRIKFNTDFNYRYSPSVNRYAQDESLGFSLDNYFRDRMNYTRFRLSGWMDLTGNGLTLSAGYINTWKDYTRRDYYSRKKLNGNSYLRDKLWATISRRFSDKAQISLTGWAEQVHLENDGQKKNQLPLGGNAMVFYRLSAKNWMRLNYDCNVEYPDQGRSTAYGYFTDSLTWTGGNPWLKSNVSHDIRFWIDLWRCFNFQTGYIFSPNRFCSIGEAREGTLPSGAQGTYASYVYQNTRYNEWWASVSLTKRFCKNFVYKADFQYRTLRSSYGPFVNHGRGIVASTSLNYYNVPWKMNFSFYYLYRRGLSIYPQSKAQYNVEYPALSIQKYLMDNRLEFKLSYIMMFHFFNADNISKENSPVMVSSTLDKSFDRQKHRLVFSVSYRFAGGKSVRQYKRDLANER
jgi:hypothetical protein